MTTYRFCVAPGGTLVCYKVNNGFIKFTGSYAQQLLEHIKEFSFYTFNSDIKKASNDKYTYDLTFKSNNHHVIFEDVKTLKEKESISIENDIKDLVNIVKENNVQKESNVNKKKQTSALKKLKALLYAATLSTTMFVSANNNLEVVKAQTNEDSMPLNTDSITAMATNYSMLNNNETTTPNIIPTTDVLTTTPDTSLISSIQVPTSDATLLSNNHSTVDNVNPSYIGPVLNKHDGIIHNGPAGGDESYYDLDMSRVVRTMREKGFDEINYPYWVRADGVKMLGNFVMVAANLQVHPRGSVVQTSLGTGLVCDTGAFAKTNKLKLDIATTWTKGI